VIFDGHAAEVGIAALIAALAAFHIEIAGRRDGRGHLYAFGVVLVTLGLYYSPLWEESYTFTQTTFQWTDADNTRFWYLVSTALLLLGLLALFLVKRRR
jgi:hypothetical protein